MAVDDGFATLRGTEVEMSAYDRPAAPEVGDVEARVGKRTPSADAIDKNGGRLNRLAGLRHFAGSTHTNPT